MGIKMPSDSRIRTDALEIQMAVLICVLALDLHKVESIVPQLRLPEARVRYALDQLVQRGYLNCHPSDEARTIGVTPMVYQLALIYRREAHAIQFERQGATVDREGQVAKLREMVRRKEADHEKRRPLRGERDALWSATVLNLPKFRADGSLVGPWEHLKRLLGGTVQAKH